MAVFFLFVDGIGLGKANKDNPFYRDGFQGFAKMTGGEPLTREVEEIITPKRVFKAVDATLGVEGLPQSGTGQTALFTGRNAAKELGRHFGPFPHSEIKKFLRKESIFHKVQQEGLKGCFMNAYPEIFFEKAEKKNRWSCTTLMAKSAGVRLNREKDVREGNAITAEITQQTWREQLNINVPRITPEEAAGRMIRRAEKEDFLLHEYYLTDKAGHAKSQEKAERYLSVYDRFLDTLIREKRNEDTIVLSSDHGNLEDLSVKTHTLNPVPLFVLGPGSPAFYNAKSIMDITPAIMKALI